MENLEYGASGEFVKRLQERLSEFGFYHGVITGRFDRETETAVKDFQEKRGLAADGFVGIITRQKLGLPNLDEEQREIREESDNA